MIAYQYAVETLLEAGADELPIKDKFIECIIESKGWKVKYFDLANIQYRKLFEKLNLMWAATEYKGFSCIVQGMKYVFINQELCAAERTYVLAHELGHIKFEHITADGENTAMFHVSGDGQEREANDFARHFLAPECVLKTMGIKDMADVRYYTLLDDDILKIYYVDYKQYKIHNDNKEKMLLANFSDYMQINKVNCTNNYVNGIITNNYLSGIIKKFAIAFVLVLLSNIFVTVSTKEEQPHKSQTENVANNQNSQIESPQIESDNKIILYRARTGRVYHQNVNCSHIRGKTDLTKVEIESIEDINMPLCKTCGRQK